MATRPDRTSQIETRITSGPLSMFEHAAELQGRSVSDFVVAAALEAAERTIEESQTDLPHESWALGRRGITTT